MGYEPAVDHEALGCTHSLHSVFILFLDCCDLVSDRKILWPAERFNRHASAIPTSQTRAHWAVGGQDRGGSGRRMVSPQVLSGGTAQPVLMSVTRASLPQFVGHTPRRPHANWVGLVMDCASDAPHQREAAHMS